jgi:hypothetical protein
MCKQPLWAALCQICPTPRIPTSLSKSFGNKRVPVYYLQSLFKPNLYRAGATVRITSNRVAQSAALLLVLGLLAGLSACGGGASAGTVTAVAITPTTASVQVNDQTEFTATVSIAGQTSTTTTSTSTSVTWLVNNVAGGNSTIGTIVNDVNDSQVGIYTAPTKVPSSTTAGQSGQVSITATAQRNPNGTASGGANVTITSNVATLTVSPGLGLQIVSPPTTVPAGGSAQFNATMNGVADPNATWTVSSTNGGAIGSINANSGVYQAPSVPPPGDSVTITASDSGVTATPVTVAIVYSDLALHGSFAFSYTGNDSQGYLASAGSFFADGQGHILSGVEDVSSFLSGVTSGLPIASTSSYKVNPDGRGIASLNTGHGTQTLAFVLTTNEHALITRFDSAVSGSGTMDQQNLVASLPTGSYVFTALGTDAAFNPEGMAGEFSANGGTISAANSSIDLHDGASSTATITTNSALTANSSYAFDTSNQGTGRGTLTLNVPGIASALEFAFYVVDNTQMYLLEIDGANGYLSGTAFTADTASPGLAAQNYVFTSGGMASITANSKTTVGPYAVGGVFVSGGTGTVSSGTLDLNNQGTATLNSALLACPYSTNGTNGRVDLKLASGSSGSCPASAAANLSEFAMYPYQTDESGQPATGFLLLEIDANALSSGVALGQSGTTAPSGGLALGLAGQGILHGSVSPAAQDVDGEFSSLAGSLGNLDVNYFQPSSNDPVTAFSGSAASTTGRGTLTVSASSPKVTYDLVYYVVSPTEDLLLDADANPALVLTGTIQKQF